jgi:hypothetical protein
LDAASGSLGMGTMKNDFDERKMTKWMTQQDNHRNRLAEHDNTQLHILFVGAKFDESKFDNDCV